MVAHGNFKFEKLLYPFVKNVLLKKIDVDIDNFEAMSL